MNGVSFFVSVVFVFRGDLRGIKVENHATHCRMAIIITERVVTFGNRKRRSPWFVWTRNN